jgi:DNA-binding response OmpR family regulator
MTETPCERQRPRVLVVEDDPATSQAMRLLLQHHGYDVQVCGTVAESMNYLGSNPDFVLLDLMLPDGDGADVLEHIRENDLRPEVVVVTGVSEPAWHKRVERLHPKQVLRKPVNVSQILAGLGNPGVIGSA